MLELVREQGPIGADRLYNLARLGYYDDTRFHRVNKEYIAQFGLHGNPAVNAAWKDQYLADDPPRSDNKRGTFAFAMKGAIPRTRNRQIYINLKDNPRSDAEPFTMLGTVVEGMAVVDSLYSGYGENSGSGVRQGKQGPLEAGGNAFMDKEYPLLDRINRVTVRPSTAADSESKSALMRFRARIPYRTASVNATSDKPRIGPTSRGIKRSGWGSPVIANEPNAYIKPLVQTVANVANQPVHAKRRRRSSQIGAD